jgi:membrane-bound lytic murein transglycosylase D
MESEFRRLGLPTELTRLPFVESSFNEDARSKAGASGVWQIMPRTGLSYRMMVNDKIDERNSPLKATYVAGKPLHSYNHALGSWPLTITSYNHGIGNIQKAIKRARSRDLTEIIARYHRGDFKFASANYYTCFLAALYAEKYNELIFKDVPRQPLQEHEVIKLSGATGLTALQRRTGLDRKELLKYNLDLRSALRGNLHLPRGYELHLPPGYKSRLLRQVGAEPKAPRDRTALNE